MANVAHASLTGSQLHEPKGVAAASANTVYAADGAGSGAWTDVNTLVTATNFTTGDIKLTLKTTADSSWVMFDDKTIGSALSAASGRANADCENLFLLLWNNIPDAWAPVITGRGANAAADWAANKAITLPRALGRALAIAGSGSGLTARTLGSYVGEENHTMTQSELVSHAHSGTTQTESTSHAHAVTGTTGTESNSHTHSYDDSGSGTVPADTVNFTGSVAPVATVSKTTGSASTTHTHSFSLTSGTQNVAHTHTFTSNSTGSTTPFNVVQPTSFLNAMVKL